MLCLRSQGVPGGKTIKTYKVKHPDGYTLVDADGFEFNWEQRPPLLLFFDEEQKTVAVFTEWDNFRVKDS